MQKSKSNHDQVFLGDLLPMLDLIEGSSTLDRISISEISSVSKAGGASLVFISSNTYLERIAKFDAAAVVTSSALASSVTGLTKAPILVSHNVMLAFAHCSRFFSSDPVLPKGIHPSADIHPSAKVSDTASIGSFVSIAAGSVIEDGAVLHSGVRVGQNCVIGKACTLFSNVVLYQGVELAEGVRIHANSVVGADGFGYVQQKHSKGVTHVKIHHTGGVYIGPGTEVGASTTIDRGTLEDTRIGAGCIIDNQVQIGHNCQIGEGVIICGSSGLAGSAVVGPYAVIGGFVGVGKVVVGAGAQVAGFSAVSRDVPPGVKWGGVPAMHKSDYNRLQVLLARLPELVKDFKERKRESR